MVGVALCGLGKSYAQPAMYNIDTRIFVPAGDILYINGDYEDDGTTVGNGAFGNIINNGTIIINGNITNNGLTDMFSTVADINAMSPTDSTRGSVILSGNGNQRVLGSRRIFFNNLTINKPAGTEVDMFNDVFVQGDVTINSGNIDIRDRLFQLNLLNLDGSLSLAGSAQIGVEGNNNRFLSSQATGGRISITKPINQAAIINDLGGTGFSFTSDLNVAFLLTQVQRQHIQELNVANDNVIRNFGFQPPVNSGNLESITIEYFNSELPSGLTHSDLTLYVSNDDGATWTKFDNAIDSSVPGQITVNEQIPIVGGVNNLLALANRICTDPPAAALDIPVGAVTVINGNTVDACLGDDLNLFSTHYYHWIGEGLNPNEPLVITDLEEADERTYMIFVRDTRGCEDLHTITLNVRDLPIANYDYPISRNGFSEICDTDFVDFVNTSVGVDGAIVSYLWDFSYENPPGNPVTSTDVNPTTVFPAAAEYQVFLTATSEYNCVHTTNQIIRVQPLPQPNFDIQNEDFIDVTIGCEEEPIILVNNTPDYIALDAQPRTLKYDWDFGDGQSFSEVVPPFTTPTNPIHAWNLTGNFSEVFTIRLTASAVVLDGGGSVIGTICQNFIEYPITILPKPEAQFFMHQGGGAITEVCSGEEVFMTNQSTISDGAPLTYFWDFGDGETSTDVNPSKIWDPLDETLFDVTLIASTLSPVGHICRDTVVIQMLVHPPVLGGFEVVDLDICQDEQAELTNRSYINDGTISSYLWDFKDGTTSTSLDSTVFHSFPEAKRYEVSLTRTSTFGCVNTVTRAINVHPLPVPAFFFNDVCDGETVEFFNNSTIQADEIVSYFWDFDDGTTSIEESPIHKYSTHGTYNVTMTVTSNFGCDENTTQSVTVSPLPSFDLGPSVLACANDLTLDPADDPTAFIPPGSTYEWRNPFDVVVSTDPTLSVNTSGVYSVKITTANLCDSLFNIPVFLLPPVDLGADFTVCDEVVLDAETSGIQNIPGLITSYVWRENDENGAMISTDRLLSVTATGTYFIEVSHNVNGQMCSSSDVITITVEPDLIIDLGADKEICQAESILLESGIVADTYTWVNLNTGITVGSTPDITVSQEGNYQLTATRGLCTGFDLISVEVRNNPVASFTSSSSGCVGQSVTFQNISISSEGTITNYLWDFGDGTSSVISDPIHIYSEGDFDVSLTVTTDFGCTDIFNQTISVYENPIADFTIDACEGSVSNIQNLSTLPTVDVSTFLWDFGDGSSSTDEIPNKVFSEPGNYTVTLSVSQNGCEDFASKLITVDPLPIIPFSGTLTTCGTSIPLDAGNPGSTYRWFEAGTGTTLSTSQVYTATSNGDLGLEVTTAEGCVLTEVVTTILNSAIDVDLGSDRVECGPITLDAGIFPNASYGWSTGENSSLIQITESGIYSVNVIDINGCSDSDQISITINELPKVDLGEDIELCEGEFVTLDAGEFEGTYLWSTGAISRTITVDATGNYSVTLTNASGCQASDDVSIEVNPIPLVDFVFPNTATGEPTIFTNNTAFGGVVTYSWDFGDGSFSTLEDPLKVYSFPDTYSVTLTATTDQGCQVSHQQEIIVLAQPQSNFGATDGCSNEIILFENTSVLPLGDTYTFLWTFGDGNSSTETNPEHTYISSGDYVVTLNVTSSNGFNDINFKTVHIDQRPFVDFGDMITTCDDEVVLDALNLGSTYQWNDNSSNRTLTISNSGEYAVTITSPEGCVFTENVTVILQESPEPDLGPDVQVCGSVILDAGVDAATYLWSNGERTRSISVEESGTYSVEVISQDLCVSEDEINVVVNPLPEVDLGEDIAICSGQEVVINAFTSTASTYMWSTGENAPQLSVTESGVYSVTLTSDQGCEFTDEIEVQFFDLPVLDFPETAVGCGSLLLDAENSGESYLWSDGSQDQSLEVFESGNYSVTITTQQGCTLSEEIDVTIFLEALVDLGDDVEICFGESLVLDAGESGSQFIWSDGSTDRTLEVATTGTYSVAIADDNKCGATDDIRVTVRSELPLELGEDRLACEDQDIELDAGLETAAYNWFSDRGLESIERSFTAAEGGKYWLTVIDEFGCTKTDTIRVNLTNQTIEAFFLVASDIFTGQTIQFAQLSEPDPETFFWDFGDGGFSVIENPNYTYFLPGAYEVTLTVSNGICEDTITKQIIVLDENAGRSIEKELGPVIRFNEIVEAMLFPNPVRDEINLKVSMSGEEKVIVQLFNLAGNPVGEISRNLEEETFTFDLFEVPSGMYMVRIVTPSETKVMRFVKD